MILAAGFAHEKWERAPLQTFVELADIDFDNLATPYLRPLNPRFPAVDMIRLPNEMVQITITDKHARLLCKHILQHLEVRQ